MPSKIGKAPRRERTRPPFECIALLLQGGGALGAYQGGVYEGLAEAALDPDWVAGISIGAINAAIIAGNPPESRVNKLREFWKIVTTPHCIGQQQRTSREPCSIRAAPLRPRPSRWSSGVASAGC